MKTTNFYAFLALAASLFLCTSCEKLKDAADFNVDISEFKVTVPIVPEHSMEVGGVPFSDTQTISITDPQLEDLNKNIDHIDINSLNINEITVSAKGADGVIRNLQISSPSSSRDITIDEIEFGAEPYSNAELSAYAKDLMVALINSRSEITVNVDGIIDASFEAGSVIELEFVFRGVSVRVNAFK